MREAVSQRLSATLVGFPFEVCTVIVTQLQAHDFGEVPSGAFSPSSRFGLRVTHAGVCLGTILSSVAGVGSYSALVCSSCGPLGSLPGTRLGRLSFLVSRLLRHF